MWNNVHLSKSFSNTHKFQIVGGTRRIPLYRLMHGLSSIE